MKNKPRTRDRGVFKLITLKYIVLTYITYKILLSVITVKKKTIIYRFFLKKKIEIQ